MLQRPLLQQVQQHHPQVVALASKGYKGSCLVVVVPQQELLVVQHDLQPAAIRRPTASPFPVDVPEAVKTAISSYELPPQRETVPLEGGKTTPSITAFYGVMLEILPRVDGNHRRPMEWACLASVHCRHERKRL